MTDDTCSIPDCERRSHSRGWCAAHYLRWWKHGDPLAGERFQRPRGLSEAEAFAWFMPGDPPPGDQCWDWTASTRNGYGQFGGPDRTTPHAHVVAHRIYNPHDPTTADKPFVLHWCDRPICVQPAHLHAGTPADNVREMMERERGRTNKLTADDVRFIRSSAMTRTELAAQFEVHKATISAVRVRRTWRHLA